MGLRVKGDITIRICEGRCNPDGGTPESNLAKLKEQAATGKYGCKIAKGYACMSGCGLGKRVNVEHHDGSVTLYAERAARTKHGTYRRLPDPICALLAKYGRP